MFTIASSPENDAASKKVPETAVQRERRWSVVLCCAVATMLSLTTGITLAIPSNVILDVGRDSFEQHLTTFQQSVFSALASVGALFGGVFGGLVADHWGRKCSLMFSGVPIVTGYLLISYAHYSSNTYDFVLVLYIGRLFTGIGMGSSSGVVSVYVTEITSPKLRGLFGTMNECAVMCGITITYALGSIDGCFYYYISLVAVGIVALFEILMFWLPETPRSLMIRGYIKEAERIIKWLRGPNSEASIAELKEIKQHIITIKQARKEENVWKNLSRKSILVPCVYLLVIFMVKQFCGINAVIAYAGEIFVDAGVPNPSVTSTYTIGAASVIGILVAFFTTDCIGRKSLLTISGMLLFIGATLLGIHFYITRPSLCGNYQTTTEIMSSAYEDSTNEPLLTCNSHFSPLSIVSVIVYTFGFSMGWGPIPWVLLSELLPLSVRGKATGLCMIVSYLSSTIVVGFYLQYVELVTWWFAMWTFSIVSVVGSVFVLIFIPETKGKSLETVEKEFQVTLQSCHFCL